MQAKANRPPKPRQNVRSAHSAPCYTMLHQSDSLMQLRLHNTLTRRVEDFIPQDPNRVTIYLCGPTVYNYVHIGNARGPVVFGLLVRLLKRAHGTRHVVYARNVTDVDDKINAAATDA